MCGSIYYTFKIAIFDNTETCCCHQRSHTTKAAILIQSELLCYSKQCHTLSVLSDNQTVVTVFYGQIV